MPGALVRFRLRPGLLAISAGEAVVPLFEANVADRLLTAARTSFILMVELTGRIAAANRSVLVLGGPLTDGAALGLAAFHKDLLG